MMERTGGFVSAIVVVARFQVRGEQSVLPWGMVYTKIHLISPACAQLCIALQCRITNGKKKVAIDPAPRA